MGSAVLEGDRILSPADFRRQMGSGMPSTMADKLKQYRDPFEVAPVEPLDEQQVTILDWDIDGIVFNWVRGHE